MTKDPSTDLAQVMRHFQARAEKISEFRELYDARCRKRKVNLESVTETESWARAFIRSVDLAYSAAMLSEALRVFFTCFAVDTIVHETRWFSGQYDAILSPIIGRMRQIESECGLVGSAGWRLADAPEEYRNLSAKYDEELDKKLLEAFVEFGARDIAELYVNDHQHFEQLCSTGERWIRAKDKTSRLSEMIDVYEREAEASAAGGAFLSATVMLGSAIEARLLAKCIESPKEVMDALMKRDEAAQMRRSQDPLDWRLKTLIDVCSLAGWIPDLETEGFVFGGGSIAHMLRRARNAVHPQTHLRHSSELIPCQEQYKDMKAAHEYLAAMLQQLEHTDPDPDPAVAVAQEPTE